MLKTNKIKRINAHQLKQKYNKYYKREPNDVISWEFRQFLEALAEDGLYEYDYSSRNSGNYKSLVIPQIGVGLADLPNRAPRIWRYLKTTLDSL